MQCQVGAGTDKVDRRDDLFLRLETAESVPTEVESWHTARFPSTRGGSMPANGERPSRHESAVGHSQAWHRSGVGPDSALLWPHGAIHGGAMGRAGCVAQ